MITQSFDLPILDWIAAHLWCPLLDAVIPVITHLGDGGVLWIGLALVLLCLPRYRKTGLAMGLALLMGLLICNLTLKPLVARMRPFDYQLLHFGKEIPLLIAAPTDFSFPSGHTIAAFEAATVLLIRDRKWGACAMLAAVLMAFSRLYLYVHYPTDVLAAAGLGVGIAFLATYFTNKGWALYENKKNNT